METIFRVNVIKRGFECRLIVWAAGRKENVSQLGLLINLFIPGKGKLGLFIGYKCKIVVPQLTSRGSRGRAL